MKRYLHKILLTSLSCPWEFPSSLSSEVKWSEVKWLSHVRLFVTPWTVAYQASPSMGFFRQEYWNGLPFPSLGDLPDPGIEPGSPVFQADALTSEPPGKPYDWLVCWSSVQFSSVLSRVRLFATPWNAALQASCPSPLPELAQTHIHWVGDAIQPSHLLCPLLLLPSIFSRVFSNESVLPIKWPKCWKLSGKPLIV